MLKTYDCATSNMQLLLDERQGKYNGGVLDVGVINQWQVFGTMTLDIATLKKVYDDLGTILEQNGVDTREQK